MEAPTGFRVRGQEPERLLRVLLRVENRDPEHARRERGLTAHVVDGRGRIWLPVPGLGGVRLSTPVAARGSVLSEPVFRLPPDARDLAVVLEHDHWTPARLRLGDPESYGHKPALMELPATKK